MKKSKLYDWFSWFLGCVIGTTAVALFTMLATGMVWCSGPSTQWKVGDYFIVDSVSWYLVLLTLGVWLTTVTNVGSCRGYVGVVLSLSILCALVCYVVNHSLVFWVFYETTILSLLFLVYSCSPYSERLVALWYFLSYILISGLPSLLCILFISIFYESFYFNHWSLSLGHFGQDGNWVVYLIVGALFVSKIPLFPFHSWLPIVHSEATSAVSCCLSGYIMKLGFLGLSRFGTLAFPDGFVLVCLFSSIIFFGLAVAEVDVKRWLAYMSLGHTVVGLVCLTWSDVGSSFYCFYYSVGHGVSASLAFMFLSIANRSSGSRSWLSLRRWLWGNSWLLRLLTLIVLLVASIPPTLQFFAEVEAVKILSTQPFMLGIFSISLYLGVVCPLLILGLLYCSSPRDWCSSLTHSDGIDKLIGIVVFLIIMVATLFVVI